MTSNVKLLVVNDANVFYQAQTLVDLEVSDKTIIHVPGLNLSHADIHFHALSSAISADLGVISNIFKVAGSFQESFSRNSLGGAFSAITFFGGTIPMLMSEFYILQNLMKSDGQMSWFSRIDLELETNSIWDILGDKDFDGDLNSFEKTEVLPNLYRILKC